MLFANIVKPLNSEHLRVLKNLSVIDGKYCNNLATRVIPFFIVLKSPLGETILKTVLPLFSKDPAA